MREIRIVRLDRSRPAVLLTRDLARPVMAKVTVAPITTTVKGLSSEVAVGPGNGLDRDGAISVDNTVTVPKESLGRIVGYLSAQQEAQLARAVVLAFDLDLPLLDGR